MPPKVNPKPKRKSPAIIKTSDIDQRVRHDLSLLTKVDMYLLNEGSHFRMYEKMGAHPDCFDDEKGTYFAVWAPNADYVSVIGDFNNWDKGRHPLKPKENSGIWDGFVTKAGENSVYKYHIASKFNSYRADKADPFGFQHEVSPRTGSVVRSLDYAWNDQSWMDHRKANNNANSPWSVYELHLGSWKRVPEEGRRPLTYRELAAELPDYVKQLGFTHVEFMPVMEHPFYGSWGYQTTGYFSPTSRYGTPQDFMVLIDNLHQNGIGVILDWVPSHFPSDEHGLAYFDGSHLFEHSDPRKGFHPDWNSYIYNYNRNEVRSFLISNALFWLDKYHVDGLRVDAVASMLYLDYSRKNGEWIPNMFGGRENLEAIQFLQQFNHEVYRNFPDVQTIGEESTAWPKVSRPTYMNGLGFGMKWDMGWMHDTLEYMSKEPVHRKFEQNTITFRMLYAFHENFMLPLSHDEVVHGKSSLIGKMPGDDWQKFANLRALYGYMFAQPGKKLLFMGGEFGQWNEWNHDQSLDWNLIKYPFHRGLTNWIRDLNEIYSRESALHELDFNPAGFEWVDASDAQCSILSFMRRGNTSSDLILVVLNFTPVPRYNYSIGVSRNGSWSEILNSDASLYGGSGLGNSDQIKAKPIPCHGRPFSLSLTLPPLSAIFFKSNGLPL